MIGNSWGKNRKTCAQVRTRLESDASAVLGAEMERHVAGCRACGEYVHLRQWAQQVVRAGMVEVAPPLMSAVWASIHRASEQAWDSALTRSFRYLLPYMVALVALIALVGGLTTVRTPAPVQAASAAFAVLNQPEPAGVAGVMASANQPPPDPADLLRMNTHR
ncbi:MAG: hypothetical protein ACRD1C_04425 [Terriglobales bacterium]